MRYYMIQWQPEADDDPVRMYLELSDDGLTAYRRLEMYQNGIYAALEEPAPADLSTLTGEGERMILSASQFNEVWHQTRELPDGLMGLFFCAVVFSTFGLNLCKKSPVPDDTGLSSCNGRHCLAVSQWVRKKVRAKRITMIQVAGLISRALPVNRAMKV